MKQKNVIQLNFGTWLCVEFMLAAVIALSTVFRVRSLVSYAFTLSFIVFVPLTIRYFSERSIPFLLLALAIAAFFNCTINALISGEAQISFSYFYKLIMFLCTVVMFYAAVSLRLGETALRLIRLIPILIGVILVSSYYLFGNQTVVAGGITLSFINSNFAAMWLTHIVFYLVYDCLYYKKVFVKIALGVLITLCLILIYKTYARSSFFALLVFTVMLLFGPFRKDYRPSRAFCLIAAVFPLVFALVYLLIVHSDWFNRTFSFIIRTGKKLDARELIWLVALKNAKTHLLLGDYSGISRGSGVAQLHNTHIDVLCSYGILPFALFVWFLFDILKRAGSFLSSYRQYVAFSAFVAVLGIGGFEAAIVAGSTGLYFLSAGILSLILADRENSDERASPLAEVRE